MEDGYRYWRTKVEAGDKVLADALDDALQGVHDGIGTLGVCIGTIHDCLDVNNHNFVRLSKAVEDLNVRLAVLENKGT